MQTNLNIMNTVSSALILFLKCKSPSLAGAKEGL